METQTAIAQTVLARVADPLIRRMWAPVMIGFGLGLTGAWMSLLGYGLITLMMLAL
jgi:hypothetical protein